MNLGNDIWHFFLPHDLYIAYLYGLSASDDHLVHGLLPYDNSDVNKKFPIKTRSLGSLIEDLGSSPVQVIVDKERRLALYIGSHLDPEVAEISKSRINKWFKRLKEFRGSPLPECWLHSMWRRLYVAKRTTANVELIDAMGDISRDIEHCHDAVRGNSTARAHAHARVYVTTKYIVTKKLKSDLMLLLGYLRTVDDSSIPRYISKFEKFLEVVGLTEINVRSVIENYGDIFDVTSPEQSILSFEEALNEESESSSELFNLQESLFFLFFFLRHALNLLGATQEKPDQEDPLRAKDQEAENKIERGRAARRILLRFDELYRQKTGSRYIRANWASEMKLAKDLLKVLTEDQILGRLQRFFEDDWVVTHKAYAFRTFVKMVNRLADMDGIDDRSEYWELVNKAQK
jgi:hypothetical protein